MYIAIIIYKSESLGHDLRTVAGPENFRPSGGVCTVERKRDLVLWRLCSPSRSAAALSNVEGPFRERERF